MSGTEHAIHIFDPVERAYDNNSNTHTLPLYHNADAVPTKNYWSPFSHTSDSIIPQKSDRIPSSGFSFEYRNHSTLKLDGNGHNASGSVATTASGDSVSSEFGIESIELAALHRYRPQMGEEEEDHVYSESDEESLRWHVPARQQTSWLPANRSVSREHVPSSRRVITSGPENAQILCKNAPTNGQIENGSTAGIDTDDSTPPLTPMSPTFRLYGSVNPTRNSVEDDANDCESVDIESCSVDPKSPYGQSELSETNSLLPSRSFCENDSLPTPVTAVQQQPFPNTITFSHLETIIHVIGVTITILLIVISVWLTVANVKM